MNATREDHGRDQVGQRRTALRVGHLGQQVGGPVRQLVARAALVRLAVALEHGEDRRRPEREVHGDREGDRERAAERLPDTALDEADDEEHREDDRQHDREEQLDQADPVEVVLRPDQPHRPVGVLAGEPHRVAELVERRLLGVGRLLAGLDPGLDRIRDGCAQLLLDVGPLVLGQRPGDGVDVAGDEVVLVVRGGAHRVPPGMSLTGVCLSSFLMEDWMLFQSEMRRAARSSPSLVVR